MLNDTALPPVLPTVGVKLYAVPAAAEVGGVPKIVGALLAGAVTSMLNAGRDADPTPSLTVMTMFENAPTAAGVPESRPVEVSKAAQDGFPEIENVRV